ncbi:hypothetical protein ACFU9Y_19085 [Streptomyces sp. NPDC057621]|uniref:hypothetical protein n=1 Tax=Streptomyces sp. NPDC057621 TaxID=3346186 RepID=UPI0036D002E7
MAWTQWAGHGVTMLRCGHEFGAARVPGDLVKAAAGSEDPADVAGCLDTALIGGGVLVDTQRDRYYFLVPPGACLRWNMPETRCLGEGWHIGVPRPGLPSVDRDRPVRLFWALEMYAPGALCVPGAVMQLVARVIARQDHAVSGGGAAGG